MHIHLLKLIYKLKLTVVSKEIIRTVSSVKPTAKKRDICSPEGAFANAIQRTSEFISFRSLCSFKCPV